jgi:hypothetical protein
MYDSLPTNDVKIIIGDANAKIGKEEEHREVIGKHSLHDRSNNNGIRLIDFSTSKNMRISSTCFPHKDIHKGTWRSPDGKTCNQIDHVIIDKRAATNILDVRTYRGANSDSDHYLVKIKYKCKIAERNNKGKQRTKKINTQNLKSSEIGKEYESEITTKIIEKARKWRKQILKINGI